MGDIVLDGKGVFVGGGSVFVGGGSVFVGVGGSDVEVASSLGEVSPSRGTKIGPSLLISVGFTTGVVVGISSAGGAI